MTSVVNGQSFPQFSQNVLSYLTVNPGFAGNTGDINGFFGSRSQWRKFEGAPVTMVFGVDKEVDLFGGENGIGLNGMRDEIGEFVSQSMNFSYARRWSIDQKRFGIGMSFGFVNQTLQLGDLITKPHESSDFHVEEQFSKESEESGTAFDAGVGLFFDAKDYYLGLSMVNLTNPKPKYYDLGGMPLRRTTLLSAGYRYDVKDKPIVLVPSMFLKSDFRSWQMDVTVKGYLKDKYWGGVGYRVQDAFVVLGGLELNTGLRIGVSLDVGMSKIKRQSVEVILGYIFDLNIEKRKKLYKSVRYL